MIKLNLRQSFFLLAALPGLLLGAVSTVAPAGAAELGAPIACSLGKDCFVQQFVDADPGQGAADPFCGIATYNGHDGTDFRILSLAAMQAGVDVVAMADGKVLRARDGVPDHLVQDEADRAAVGNRECGNGMVVAQTDGTEAQYCHLRDGSLVVKPGDEVKRGQPLAKVGASGLAQFPHVHVTLRQNGKTVDPVAGRLLNAGCTGSKDANIPTFSADVLAAIGQGAPQLLASGVTDSVVKESNLETDGPPHSVQSGAPAVVGWVWLINLQKGDVITVALRAPDGTLLANNAVPPLDHSKATYVAYAGRKRPPETGDYRVEVSVTRGTATVLKDEKVVPVQ